MPDHRKKIVGFVLGDHKLALLGGEPVPVFTVQPTRRGDTIVVPDKLRMIVLSESTCVAEGDPVDGLAIYVSKAQVNPLEAEFERAIESCQKSR